MLIATQCFTCLPTAELPPDSLSTSSSALHPPILPHAHLEPFGHHQGAYPACARTLEGMPASLLPCPQD
ncbi:hypothetical protein PAXRUDRAFT_19195 [Paxillus rubicundulus Ve08.2h10]|uniref:Uncharacterized protein n=1 Tax=Paxillus rubicundulus Ve08.2h10 TaxID=930991 RepID=A0A0D0CVS4_9AGAM|nr:hypothetical protein PAXRUDRAFT_19195 [Paxillus rubicundulus Ve08.2h10]